MYYNIKFYLRDIHPVSLQVKNYSGETHLCNLGEEKRKRLISILCFAFEDDLTTGELIRREIAQN